MTSSRRYKIARAGQELGVFEAPAVSEGLRSGRFAWTDDCWGEGDSKWGKLSDIAQILQAQQVPVATPPRNAAPSQPAAPVAVASPTRPASSGPAVGWVAYVGVAALVAILLVMLFGLFRQDKWEYHQKVFVFPDREYIDQLQAPSRWEYTYVSVPARSAKYTTLKADREGHDAMSAAQIDREKLKSLTEDMTRGGWELAGTAMEIETAYPNFGKDEYVTGLRENVRPQALLMVFRKAIAIDHGRMTVGRTKQQEMAQAYCVRMGEEGWELVSTIRESDADLVLNFKRPKR